MKTVSACLEVLHQAGAEKKPASSKLVSKARRRAMVFTLGETKSGAMMGQSLTMIDFEPALAGTQMYKLFLSVLMHLIL